MGLVIRDDRLIHRPLNIEPAFSASEKIQQAVEGTSEDQDTTAHSARIGVCNIASVGGTDACNVAAHDRNLPGFHIEDEG